MTQSLRLPHSPASLRCRPTRSLRLHCLDQSLRTHHVVLSTLLQRSRQMMLPAMRAVMPTAIGDEIGAWHLRIARARSPAPFPPPLAHPTDGIVTAAEVAATAPTGRCDVAPATATAMERGAARAMAHSTAAIVAATATAMERGAARAMAHSTAATVATTAMEREAARTMAHSTAATATVTATAMDRGEARTMTATAPATGMPTATTTGIASTPAPVTTPAPAPTTATATVTMTTTGIGIGIDTAGTAAAVAAAIASHQSGRTGSAIPLPPRQRLHFRCGQWSAVGTLISSRWAARIVATCRCMSIHRPPSRRTLRWARCHGDHTHSHHHHHHQQQHQRPRPRSRQSARLC
jgi:hypothetical protein